MDEITRWINELIHNDNVHDFYNSSLWSKKQQQILKEQHYECQHCKSKGLYKKASTVHHIKYLRRYPELSLEDSNLEAVCYQCHYAVHHKKNGFTNRERW